MASRYWTTVSAAALWTRRAICFEDGRPLPRRRVGLNQQRCFRLLQAVQVIVSIAPIASCLASPSPGMRVRLLARIHHRTGDSCSSSYNRWASGRLSQCARHGLCRPCREAGRAGCRGGALAPLNVGHQVAGPWRRSARGDIHERNDHPRPDRSRTAQGWKMKMLRPAHRSPRPTASRRGSR
jgi:hypothetical protein